MTGGASRGAALTRGALLSRNVAINTLGQLVPLGAALVAVPILLEAIGASRFGVLSLAWMVIGAFSLFDFGLGRAATQLIAEKLGAGREAEIPAVFWTSLALLLAVGAVGGLALFLAAPWLVDHGLQIPPELREEVQESLFLIAAAVPVLASTAGLLGALEARQLFFLANAVRTPLGVFYFVGPLGVLPFSRSLYPIVAVVLAGRLAGWLVYLALGLSRLGAGRRAPVFDGGTIRRLLRVGGWMTVSNLISPLMGALDRFLVGGMLSAAAVAHYAAPLDALVRVLILPGAFVGVFFPAFATAFAMDRERTAELFRRGLKFTALALFPICFALTLFGREGLALWLGGEFARESGAVAPLIAIGVFANSLALLPFALIQGAGRADLTAKLHAVEFPLYAAGMAVLIARFGIEGAALGWTLRAGVDAALLFWLGRRVLRRDLWGGGRGVSAALGALAALGAALLPAGAPIKAGYLLAVAVGFLALVRSQALAADERAALRALWRRLTGG